MIRNRASRSLRKRSRRSVTGVQADRGASVASGAMACRARIACAVRGGGGGCRVLSPSMDIDGVVGRGYARSAMEIKTRRWKRIEYQRLIEAGCFEAGDRVELVGGQLIVAEPQASGHFAAIRAVEEALRAAFGPGWEVRGQGPLARRDRRSRVACAGTLRLLRANPRGRRSCRVADRPPDGSQPKGRSTRGSLADTGSTGGPVVEVHLAPGPDAARVGWRMVIEIFGSTRFFSR